MSTSREIRELIRSSFNGIASIDSATRGTALQTLQALVDEEAELLLSKSHPSNSQSRDLIVMIRNCVNGIGLVTTNNKQQREQQQLQLQQGEKFGVSVEFVSAITLLANVDFADHIVRFALFSSVLRKILRRCYSCAATATEKLQQQTQTQQAQQAEDSLQAAFSAQSPTNKTTSHLGNSSSSSPTSTSSSSSSSSSSTSISQQQKQIAYYYHVAKKAAKAWGELLDGGGASIEAAAPLVVRSAWVESIEMLVEGKSSHRRTGTAILEQILQRSSSIYNIDWCPLIALLVHICWNPLRDQDADVRTSTGRVLELALTTAVTSSSNSPVASSTAVNEVSSWLQKLSGVAVVLLKEDSPSVVHAALLVIRAVVKASTSSSSSSSSATSNNQVQKTQQKLPNQQQQFVPPTVSSSMLIVIREFFAKSLKQVNSLNALIRSAILESLPDVAAQDPSHFASSLMQPVEEACAAVFRLSPRMEDRAQMFLVLGRLTKTLPYLVRIFAVRIVPHIENNLLLTSSSSTSYSSSSGGMRQNIPIPGPSPVKPINLNRNEPCFAAVKCLAMLAEADPAAVRPYILPLADALFCNIPTKEFSEDINKISRIFPELRFICFDRILSLLREQLEFTSSSSSSHHQQDFDSSSSSSSSATAVAGGVGGVGGGGTTILSSSSSSSSYSSPSMADRLAALDSLLALDFSDFSLLDFLWKDVVPRLTDPNSDVRKAAVTACARLVFSGCRGSNTSPCQLVETSTATGAGGTLKTLKHQGKKHIADVNAIIFRLLDVAVADTDSSIRLLVIESLTPEFDSLIALQDACRKLVPALNDKFQNRLAALKLMGRLSKRNPAVVSPILRRVMLQCSTELQVFSKSKRQEHAAILLGTLVETAPTLVAPYISALLGGLVSKLEDLTIPEALRTPILDSIAKLTLHVDADVNEHLLDRLKKAVIPYITHRGARTEARRSAAIRALSSVVRVTGHWVTSSSSCLSSSSGTTSSSSSSAIVLNQAGFMLTTAGGGDLEVGGGDSNSVIVSAATAAAGGGGEKRKSSKNNNNNYNANSTSSSSSSSNNEKLIKITIFEEYPDLFRALTATLHGGLKDSWAVRHDVLALLGFVGAVDPTRMRPVLHYRGGGSSKDQQGGNNNNPAAAAMIQQQPQQLIDQQQMQQQQQNNNNNNNQQDTTSSAMSLPGGDEASITKYVLSMIVNLLNQTSLNDDCYSETISTLASLASMPFDSSTGLLYSIFTDMLDLMLPALIDNMRTRPTLRSSMLKNLCVVVSCLKTGARCVADLLVEIVCTNLESNDSSAIQESLSLLLELRVLNEELQPHLPKLLPLIVNVSNMTQTKYQVLDCFAQLAPQFANHLHIILVCVLDLVISPSELASTRLKAMRTIACFASQGPTTISEHASSIIHALCRVLVDCSTSAAAAAAAVASSSSSNNNQQQQQNSRGGVGSQQQSVGGGSSSNSISGSQSTGSMSGLMSNNNNSSNMKNNNMASSSSALNSSNGEVVREAVLTLCDIAVSLGPHLYQKFAVNVSSIIAKSTSAPNSISSATNNPILINFEERIRQRKQRSFDELERNEPLSITDHRAVASGWTKGLKLAEFLKLTERSHPDDWGVWLKKFRISLLCTTRSSALHCCFDLAQSHEPFARQLFYCAFRSVFEDPDNFQLREPTTRWLTQVLEFGDLEVVQELLNLDEYLGRVSSNFASSSSSSSAAAAAGGGTNNAGGGNQHQQQNNNNNNSLANSVATAAAGTRGGGGGTGAGGGGGGGYSQLRLDTAMLLKRSSSCKLYAKALRYAEETLSAKVLEFESAKLRGTLRPLSQREWSNLLTICEQVIRLSNEMGQRESAQGVLAFLQNNFGILTGRLNERFTLSVEMYANLQWWTESQRACEDLVLRQPHQLHGYHGFLRALDEQGNLARVLNQWRVLRSKKFSVREVQKHKIADFGAKAAWLLGEWKDLIEAMPAMSDEKSRDGTLTFYKATSLLHQNKPDEALAEIRLCRQQLDPVASTLIAESYTRAYSLIVSLQQLSELEEMAFLQQKCMSVINNNNNNQIHTSSSSNIQSISSSSSSSSSSSLPPLVPPSSYSSSVTAAASGSSSSSSSTTMIDRYSAEKELSRLRETWSNRLKNMAQLPQEWQGTITNHSLVLDRKNDLSSWLHFLRVCNDNGRPSTAEHFLQEILQVKDFTEVIRLQQQLPYSNIASAQSLSLSSSSSSSSSSSRNHNNNNNNNNRGNVSNIISIGSNYPKMAVLEAMSHMYNSGKRIVAMDNLATFLQKVLPSVLILHNNNQQQQQQQQQQPQQQQQQVSPFASDSEKKECAACLSRLALWRTQQLKAGALGSTSPTSTATAAANDSTTNSLHAHYGSSASSPIQPTPPLGPTTAHPPPSPSPSSSSSSANAPVKRIIEELTLALQLDPSHAGIWRQMALFHKTMSSKSVPSTATTTTTSAASSSSSSLAGKEHHVIAAMRGFVNSVYHSVGQGKSGYVQDLLGFLSLWFTSNPHNSPLIEAAVHDLVPIVPIIAWLDVVPQLIARVAQSGGTNAASIRNEVRQILICIATQHPQSLLFPLQVCLNSESSNASAAALAAAAQAQAQAAAAAAAQQQQQQQQPPGETNNNTTSTTATTAAPSNSNTTTTTTTAAAMLMMNNNNIQITEQDRALLERRAASEEILAKICEIHGEAGRLMRAEAELVAKELTRTAVLWPQMFIHEIELAHVAWSEQNATVQQVMDYLIPLKKKLEHAETEAERHFVAEYAKYIHDALQSMERCVSVYREHEMRSAWDVITNLYVKLTAEVKSTTSLLLHYVSPSLTEIGRVRPLTVAVPGQYRPVGEYPKIASMDPTFKVLSSKARPRKLTMFATDGKRYSFLLKGLEDLRQDERVIQLIGLTNTLLEASAATSRKEFVVTTMAVVPLSDTAGIIQWIENCDTLTRILHDHRRDSARMRREGDALREFADITDQKDDQTADRHLNYLQKLEVFDRSLQQTDGCDLAHFMWVKSPNAEAWLDRRTAYIRSLAVMSMLGYILGLGDRHPGNLMLHAITNCVVHVDFGDSFESAILRSQLPEKVPFRLTRLLVRALEVCGVDGLFRHSCDSVMRVLRGERDCLLAVLEAFVHDPLVSWRAKREGDAATATSNQQPQQQQQQQQQQTAAQQDQQQHHQDPSSSSSSSSSSSAQQQQQQEQQQELPSQQQRPNLQRNAGNLDSDNNENNTSTGGGVVGMITRQSVSASFHSMRNQTLGGEHVSVVRTGVSMYRTVVEQQQIANTRAQEILQRIQDKLLGMEKTANPTMSHLVPSRLKPRSVHEQVRMLIEEATSSENLSQMYRGWVPYW